MDSTVATTARRVLVACERCGKERLHRMDRVERGQGRFCSKSCARGVAAVIACARCGRPTRKVQFDIDRGAAYCSKSCAAGNPPVEVACKGCGKPGRVSPSRAAHCAYWCSPECRRSTTGPLMVECEACGAPTLRWRCEIRMGSGRFCSKECGRSGAQSSIANEIIDAFLAESPHLAIREHRVGRYSIDLALPILMIAIELDGIYWHSLPGAAERDARKDAVLTAAGWTVRRVRYSHKTPPTEILRDVRAACHGGSASLIS